jgi:hypothetical protein
MTLKSCVKFDMTCVSFETHYEALTDENNRVFLYYQINITIVILHVWFSFDTTICFDCPHQPSSGRALLHKKNKRREASPYKEWV